MLNAVIITVAAFVTHEQNFFSCTLSLDSSAESSFRAKNEYADIELATTKNG